MMNITKRKLLNLFVVLPWLACYGSVSKADGLDGKPDPQQRFKRVPLIMVINAVPNNEMQAVEFFAEGSEVPFLAKGTYSYKNGDYMSSPLAMVPSTVRVVWRKNPMNFPINWGSARYYEDDGSLIRQKLYIPQGKFDPAAEIERRKLLANARGFVHMGPWGSGYTGELAGDYTFPVASRIPDEVIESIRAHGGGLRLKFRLKPDGVMFGWDIERSAGSMSAFFEPGGDFKEARIVNGKVVQKGWYINPQGQRIETDW